MKLLFDQNLSFKLCSQLSDVFPETNQVRLVGLAAADGWRNLALCGREWLRTRDAGCWLRRNGGTSRATAKSCLAPLRQPAYYDGWILLRNHREIINAFEGDAAACLEIYW